MVTRVICVAHHLSVKNNLMSAISNLFWQQWQQARGDFIHIQTPSNHCGAMSESNAESTLVFFFKDMSQETNLHSKWGGDIAERA